MQEEVENRSVNLAVQTSKVTAQTLLKGLKKSKYRRSSQMNKTELIAAMAEKAELSKKDADKALAAFVEVVEEELVKGGKVTN